jgi:hypothetical protein
MDPVEYERRKQFFSVIQTMSKAEQIELARILRSCDVHYSENTNGILFDLAKLPQDVFDKLIEFKEFVKLNNEELNKRDAIRLATKAFLS